MTASYRELVLWEVAERYHELIDPLSSAGIKGDGEVAGLLGMPPTYTPTVREFERLLGVMRGSAGQDWFRDWRVLALRWHLLEWHLKAERVMRRRPVLVSRKGKLVQMRDGYDRPVTRPVAEFRRHPRAVEDRARDAVAWIADRWECRFEPVLPESASEQKARREARASVTDDPVVVTA